MSGFTLQQTDFDFIGLCLEGYLYGLYTTIFIIYLQHRASRMGEDKKTTIFFCSICLLYILSTAIVAMDIARFMLFDFAMKGQDSIVFIYNLPVTVSLIFGICDFIAQSILIYRCWIVWNSNIRVVILPSILALAFIVSWAVDARIYLNDYYQAQKSPNHSDPLAAAMTVTSLALSATVNTLVTGLIVFRIIKVYWETRPNVDEPSSADGGNKLRPVIFILVESGIALCSIQLTRLVFVLVWTDTIMKLYQPLICIQQMVTSMTPTIILVRVSMGLSFYDAHEESMVVSGMRFEHNHPNSTSDSGDTTDVQDSGEKHICVSDQSDDIDTILISSKDKHRHPEAAA